MKLPSKEYFDRIKTKQEFLLFLDSDWVANEPNAPTSWEAHQELINKVVEFRACGIHEWVCNCPCFVSFSGRRYYTHSEALNDSMELYDITWR